MEGEPKKWINDVDRWIIFPDDFTASVNIEWLHKMAYNGLGIAEGGDF